MKKYPSVVLVIFALVFAQGSACRGLVKPDPTQTEIEQVHASAKRIGDSVVMIESILTQASAFIDATPLTVDQKNKFDCLVVKANGTSKPRPELIPICGPSTPQGPGPVPMLLQKTKDMTTEVGLQNTVREILSVVQPLLVEMQTSTNSTIKALGVGLGAAVGILTAFLSGGF